MPDSPNVAAAWKKRSAWLAGWTAAQLLNRNDLWARYLSDGKQKTVDGQTTISRIAPMPAKRGILRLGERALMRHFRGEERGDLIGIQSASAENQSRWVAINLECLPQPIPPAKSLQAANHWFEELTNLGLVPLFINSDGTGGYQLIVIFRQPIPTATAHEFISTIIHDYAQIGLEQPPAIYPNKPEFDENNWFRLPGRHPITDHWSTVWSRRRWHAGADAIDAILSAHGDSPSLIRALVSSPLVKATPASMPVSRPMIVPEPAPIIPDLETDETEDGSVDDQLLCYVLAASRKADSNRMNFEPRIGIIEPEDFKIPQHRYIFNAINHLRNKSERITPSAIAEDIPIEDRTAALSIIDRLIVEKPVSDMDFEALVTKVRRRPMQKVLESPAAVEIPHEVSREAMPDIQSPLLSNSDSQKERLLELWPSLNPAVRLAIIRLAESAK